MTDLSAALERLGALGLGGDPRRIEVSGVAMAVVRDPDGVLVELVDSSALGNLEQLQLQRS
jgi:catechol 2,3-dioxygenase-like lactoylglutathione lyase family enzyme